MVFDLLKGGGGGGGGGGAGAGGGGGGGGVDFGSFNFWLTNCNFEMRTFLIVSLVISLIKSMDS